MVAVGQLFYEGGISLYIKGNKRKLQAEATKQRIFDIAHELFQESGFENVTVEDIAEQAGISAGALYHHYKGKFDILIAWHDQLDEKYMNEYKELQKPLSDGTRLNTLEILREILLYMNETCVYYGAGYISTIYSHMLIDDYFAAIMTDKKRSYFKILNELVAKGKLEGLIRENLSASILVKDITIISRGCLMNWAIERSQDTIRAHTESILDSFLRGIAAP